MLLWDFSSPPDEHGRYDRYNVSHLSGQFEQDDGGWDCVRDGAGKCGSGYNLLGGQECKKLNHFVVEI